MHVAHRLLIVVFERGFYLRVLWYFIVLLFSSVSDSIHYSLTHSLPELDVLGDNDDIVEAASLYI